MANLRGRKARNAGSSAFALGFSDKMKSVAGAAAVLMLATTGTVVVQAQVALPAAVAQTSAPAGTDQIIDADAIATGRVTKAANLTDAHGVGKGLISGHVYLTSPNGNPGASYDNGNVKLDGITVYAQFRDKDGSYSPIFSAKTHTLPNVVAGNGGQGTFAFGMDGKGITWKDKLGNEHTWSARTDQQHRIWVEPFTNDRGNRVEMFRQANGWTPGSFNGVVDGPMGSFVAADGNMQLMAAFLREVPPNHENSYMAAKGDKLVEDPKGPISAPGAQLGESNVLSGQVWLETGGSPDWGFPATGPKRDSVTQDPAADGYTVYASTLTKNGAAANAALHQKFKNDPNKLAEETKKMLEAHPEYILKTVYGKTDKEGNYSLRFGEYTDKSQTREDFLNPSHVYVWVENKDGVVQNGYTGFHTPIFQRFNDGGNFKPADGVPAENQAVTSRIEDLNTPRYGKPLNSIYNVRHALMPYAPVSIKADYNATDKPASPGTKVTPEFSGDLSSLPSKIEWRDKNGKVVKTCDLDQSKTVKDQVADCTFDIPADAANGDIYNVVVVSGNNDVAAWSVLVEKGQASEFEPKYEGGSGKPGDEVKVPAPSFKDKDGNPTTAPEGTTFAPGVNGPDGVTVDPKTGEVTVKVPEDAKSGDKITVPVEVTYPDGTKDTVDVTVTVGQPDAPVDQPDWKDGSGKPGDELTLPNDGGPVKEGTTVETEGPGKAIIDDKGNIKVDIDDDAKPGDKITVVVKDPEGNVIDKVTVTVEDPKTPGEPGGDGSLPGGDNSGSLGSSDGLIPGLIGGGIIGGLIGGSLGNNGGHGSSTPGKPGAPAKPGKPGEAKPGKPGAGNAGADKGGNTGNNGAGNTGNAGDNGAANQGGNAGAGQSNTGDNAADQGNRGGQLAMTGVSGVAVTLGAAVLALAVGGALLALRRRRES